MSMEPTAIIISALAAGAAALLKDAANLALRDAYEDLKVLIQNRFRENQAAETALAEYEQDPETWQKPLEKAITTTRVDKDPDILHAAEKLMEIVQPPQGKVGKYNISITGNVQGLVSGDNAQVTMNFGDNK